MGSSKNHDRDILPFTAAAIQNPAKGSVLWRPKSDLRWLDGSTECRLGVNNVFNAPRLNAVNVTTSARVGLGRNAYVAVTRQF